MNDYLDIASMILKDVGWEASEDEAARLAENMHLLQGRGLGNLNQRLRQGGRKVWDTIAEHNFAVALVLEQPMSTLIEYEPEEDSRRPIDFKVEREGLTYWIQVKNFARLARENKQRKLFRQIDALAKDMKIGKFLCCYLSDDFNEQDIPELMKFISSVAGCGVEEQKFYFPNASDPKARVSFIMPKEKRLSHLVIGISGDIDVVELTGLSENQMKGSLRNASDAFEWTVNQSTVNLIVVEADREKDINIGNALFGTNFIGVREGRHFWDRQSNGLFGEVSFSKKVAGLIVMRRRERKPVCKCSMLLYINDLFSERIGDIAKLIGFSKVILSNMFPPSGKGGNF